MRFTEPEKEKLKAMIMYLVQKKKDLSAGHNGFKLIELQPIINELVEENKLEIRPTMTNNYYFIKPKTNEYQ